METDGAGRLLRPNKEPKKELLGCSCRLSIGGRMTEGGLYDFSMSCRVCRYWMMAAHVDISLGHFLEGTFPANILR